MKPHLESELILCGPSCLGPSFPHYLQSPARWKPSYCSALKEYFSLSPLDISFLLRQSNYHCNLGGSCRCKMATLSSLLQTVFAGAAAADERKLINFLECFLGTQQHQREKPSRKESMWRAQLCPLPLCPPAMTSKRADPPPSSAQEPEKGFFPPFTVTFFSSRSLGDWLCQSEPSSEPVLC